MIRSESEYKEAVRRLKEQDQLLSEQKQKLEDMNLSEGSNMIMDAVLSLCNDVK